MPARFLLSPLLIALLLTACGNSDEEVSRFTSSGDSYYGREDYDAAQIEYSNALQQNPHHLPALEGLARVYDKKQQEAEHYRLLARILEQRPQDVSARKRVVNLLSRYQQLGKALEQSEQLMTIAGDQIDIQVVHASLLYRNNRIDEGHALAQKVLQAEPGNVHARMLLATEALEGGDGTAGIELLQPALAHAPDDLSLNLLQIQLLQAVNEPDRARDVFRTLLAEHPDDFSVHWQYVEFLESSAALDEAIGVMQAFSQRHPTPETLLELVRLTGARDGQASADDKLRELASRFPQHDTLQIALVERLLNANQLAEAGKLIERLGESALDEALSARLSMLRAQHLSSSGDQKLALANYRSLLERRPQYLPAVLAIAEIQLQQGDVSQAIIELRAALSFAARSADLHRLLGRAHAQQNLRELAQDHYSKAYELGVDQLEVAEEYAAFLAGDGRLARAERILEKSHARGRMSIRSLTQLAELKLGLKKWREADQLAQTLEAAGAPAGSAAILRGASFSGLSRHQESIRFYQQAYEATPHQYRPLAALIGAYLKADLRPLADELLDGLLAKAPQHLHALLLKASIHQTYAEWPAAEQRYRQALTVDSRHTDTYRLLTQLLFEQNRLDDAIALIRQGQQALPGHLTFGITEATLLQRLGDIDGAEARYRQLLRDHPEADVVHNNLALILLQRGGEADLHEARSLAERFRHSQVPHFQDTLGWIYLQSGQTADAVFLLEKAAQKLPDIAEVQYHLGMAYLADNRREEASAALSKALTRENPYSWTEQARFALAQLRQD